MSVPNTSGWEDRTGDVDGPSVMLPQPRFRNGGQDEVTLRKRNIRFRATPQFQKESRLSPLHLRSEACCLWLTFHYGLNQDEDLQVVLVILYSPVPQKDRC